jgi:flagellar biosynthesis regulator FlaF
MAAEDTRKLLRVFGVTVTNFEDRSAQFLERAMQLRQARDAQGIAALLKDAADALMDLQARWMEITDLITQRQRQLLTELAALANEWQKQ